MSLTAAHRGYEYQDLLVACRFVDMLLGRIVHAYVDEKLVNDDRFDDLTTVDIIGNRERIQFKHTENDDRPLSLRTFTSDDRGLQLDHVIGSMLADRNGPGSDAKELTFRIVLRDQAPNDPDLMAVLMPSKNDPGPLIPAMRTQRLGFNPDILWKQGDAEPGSVPKQPFYFLFTTEPKLTFDDLEWACQHLIVEIGAPLASGDITAPGAAEQLLLTRIRAEVGAETFPNVDRTAVDVSAAIISAARAARQGRLNVTVDELLRRAQLRSDFGAVSRSHPVDQTLEVLRSSTVRQLVEATVELAISGGQLLVVGPPGQGKSWVCHQLLNTLADEGWLIAEHYCYLGDADGERLERVLAERVFGSLVGRLAEADPRIVTDNRPRFAADEDALISCLRRSLNQQPNRRIALVIDGIDHITRVRNRGGNGTDPSRSLAEALSSLSLPPNVVVIVLSQQGLHLKPIEEAGAKVVAIPGLDEHELKLLAARFNIVLGDESMLSPGTKPLIDDTSSTDEFLAALAERSAGNALYATYLCRETIRLGDTQFDPVTTVQNLPPFDGTLKNYYDHLYHSLGNEAGWVADVIALVDFGITRAEIREIRPDAAHRVDDALAILSPALVERATQGGVRVYHESFARYLREPFQNNEMAYKALLQRIADWLDKKGLFTDPRAFRSLLTIISEAGLDAEVINRVDREFVIRAVEVGFPSSGIIANLATAIGSAARLGDWPVVVRCIELARAAESLQSERFDSTLVAFADVQAELLGGETLANRLIDDDRLVMPARAGLQMCAAIDALGATAPWHAYMTGYRREAKSDNTAYGEASNRIVALAWLRGQLRLAKKNSDFDLEEAVESLENDDWLRNSNGEMNENEKEPDLAKPVDWTRLAKWIEHTGAGLSVTDVISAVEDTHGLKSVVRLIRSLQNPGEFCLALAERLNREPALETKIGSPLSWATSAVQYGLPAGSIHRLLNLGINPAELPSESIPDSREKLLDLTRRVQEPSIRRDDGQIGTWLDACALAAHRDQMGVNTAEALIIGEGWYRCWLRFAIRLSVAEAAEPIARGSIVIDALRLLTGDLNPFSGDPRACDLYSIHSVIEDTISRAMRLLDDSQWELALTILEEVSASVTTTISGELGGPVPPDFLLRIAVDGVTPARLGAAETHVENAILRGSARRFYADLAEYRLLAARLALAGNNRKRAQYLWREACIFLTAYGWHKDITIYELLDPLPMLIKADPARGRLRVATVQGLCERVPLHTDGRGTSHAWTQWWKLLAKADPVATVQLAVPQLLAECNEPNRLLSSALDDVWQEWYKQVDPLISGALRLTLDTTLNSVDVEQFEHLASAPSADGDAVRRIMTWLLARLDERPVTYSYSNSTELVAKDNKIVAKINKIAETMNLPSVMAINDGMSASESTQGKNVASKPTSSIATDDALTSVPLLPGLPGLARAIRVWRSRPYNAGSSERAVERFANAIGYRLIELAETGLYKEAESALRSLADASRFRDREGILRLISEGLERHGEVRLAAIAYALTWAYARGHGGWLTFGGETEIEALRHSTSLDADIACSIVADEVERRVATTHDGTYGISQALLYAFSAEALMKSGLSSIDIAFAAWDEAFAVIDARAPRVDTSDDSDYPYLPPESDNGQAAPGDLEAAFALAALGGLAHPDREGKRRAFLAVQLLLDERAKIVAPAFKIALGAISDPATLTWLLRLIELADERSIPVRESCQEILRDLVSRNLLTVRALARRLLSEEQHPLAPPTPADSELLNRNVNFIWTPDNVNGVSSEETVGFDEFLESVAGTRLRRGEKLLPGLGKAVRTRVTALLKDEAIKKRLHSQLDTLASRDRKRWPDAFLIHEQMIEETLQFVATGGRTARIMAGNPPSAPIVWEDELASALLNDPTVPLILEAYRQPRPSIPPPPGRGNEIWTHVRQRAADSTSEFVEEASEQNENLLATLAIKPASSMPVVEFGEFKGWYWLGTMEKRSIQRKDWREVDLMAKRYCALEIRDLNDRQTLTLPPIAAGNLRMWRVEVYPALGVPLPNTSLPLVGLDYELAITGDNREGLGVPDALLTPTTSLIALLNLKPGVHLSYEDDEGIGLALVTWRAEYDISDYHLAWPRTCGCGIVIRPDLLARLLVAVGEQRLVLRDFVAGDIGLQ